MAKLNRKDTEQSFVTSYQLNEITWAILQIMRRQNPDCYTQDILLYIAQCIDENNINLHEYYNTYRENKRKKAQDNEKI